MLIWFLSNHRIMCLVLNTWNKEKNTKVFLRSFLSSNGHISAYFDNFHLKFSTDTYFEVRFHSILQKYEILKIEFCDVITNELYETNK